MPKKPEKPAARKRYRPDKDGSHRAAADRNKRKIYATQEICGICGQPVEKEGGKWKYRYPHPMSPSIDHIIPVSKGGHPSDISNMQLAHLGCNRQKSDKLEEKSEEIPVKREEISNRVLPQLMKWSTYRS